MRPFLTGQEETAPYMVVPSRSLVELIRMRPNNLAELEMVWGLGSVLVRALWTDSRLMLVYTRLRSRA